MGFLTPLALTFAALSIPVIVMYMLKLRRRDMLVSSTLLWQRLLRDREANAPWQRLRRNLLLLLQLLILALLTLALARPFVPAPSVVSGSVVVLLDASASMQARDVEPTRFDAGRHVAQEIVAGLGSGDVATLIAVGPQPQVLASATNDRTLLRRALAGATPTNGPADWDAAFALAAASLSGTGDAGMQRARAVIISDGALPEALPSLPGEARFVGVGGRADNLAITALATREGSAGPQAFLRVVNYGNTDAEPLVEFIADGTLFDARRLPVPSRGSADLALTDLPYDLRVLQARLVLADEDRDSDVLPLDDAAWAVHASATSGRVLFVSEGNLFLERALGALLGVELVRLASPSPTPPLEGGGSSSPSPPLEGEGGSDSPNSPPEGEGSSDSSSLPLEGGGEESYDLYVYDGVVTDTLPAGNLWLISPVPTGEGSDPRRSGGEGDGFPIDVGGFFTATTITRVATDDPLLRYVDLSDVHVLQARAVEPPPGARVLVEAEGGPLLFVAERPEGRLVVLTFDLRDSDLPLQIAFPILTANLVDWLLPRRDAALPGSVRAGDPVPIQPDPEAAEIRVTGPDGARHALPVGDQLPVFADTDQLGVYVVEQFDRSGDALQSAYLAVNLLDEDESDIAPRDVVRVGQTEVASATREEEGRREFWPWLAGAALGVLVAEWWAYHRN